MIYQLLLAFFIVVSVLLIVLTMMQPGKQQQSLLESSDVTLFQQHKARGYDRMLQLITMVFVLVWIGLAIVMMVV